MKGTKRLAVSESAPDTNDSAFRDKRIMGGSLFDVHRAVSSQQQSMATSSLDIQRAESSRQHVRALNSQFASWVQTQLTNHPDELWEDGVQDYLAHASNIMEKFSDVVEWLKAKALNAGNASAAEPHTNEKKLVPEFENNDVKFSQEKTCTPSATATSFSGSFGIFSRIPSSGSSGLIFNNAASSGSSRLFSNNAASSGSSGLFSNNAASSGSLGLFSNNPTSGSSGASSYTAASSGSLGLFSSNATLGSSRVSSNTAASSGSLGSLFSDIVTSESSGVSSNTAVSSGSLGLFSNNATSWSSGVSSNTAASSGSLGLFSNNATSGSSGVSSDTAASWSSGVFSNIQAPVLFGSQSSLPQKDNASNDADADEGVEIPRPSSPSVKKSEEKGIIIVHEDKCKLYVKSNVPADKDTWKDMGTGQLSIRCKEGVSMGTKESKPTIVVRNDVGKVLLNALLYPGIKTNLQKNSLVAIFHTSVDDAGAGSNGGAVARTFLIRTKTEEDRNKLATAIQEYAPASRE